ncbi:MAG: 8-amino-7-oxononanoate synthase [Candidatus Sumerlaeia bacterium]|nr:8-amino-7-oxononanoate synthase [Candidatus Sumerlaeia bacterium]
MNGDTLPFLEELEARRTERETLHRNRSLRPIEAHQGGRSQRHSSVINLSHNDYLGLGRDPRVVEAAVEATRRWGTGSEGSRLITGSTRVHHQFEEAYATFKGAPACLLFPTGYQASLSVFSALCSPGDTVLCDRLVHSCLVDGIQLSGARLRVFPHQNMERLAELLQRERASTKGRLWICVDGVYSMDGDIAPLPELLNLAATHEAMLVVDDAHGTGMIGATGRGIFEHYGIRLADWQDRVVLISTLSKCLGTQGGAVCAHPLVVEELINRAKPFIYTTGLAPACAAAGLAAVGILTQEPQHVQALQQRYTGALEQLRQAGIDCLTSQTGIIPLIVGEEARALALARTLEEHGILVLPIRPPTVPNGTSRLRLSTNLLVSEADWSDALQELIRVVPSTVGRSQSVRTFTNRRDQGAQGES